MKRIIIFDLDGTLAEVEHRRHMVTPPKRDWEGFYSACVDDTPNVAAFQVFQALSRAGWTMYIFSGRSDQVRKETEAWLATHGIVLFEKLVMRKFGDHTPDDKLKEQFLHEQNIDIDEILCVFDDRDKVVKKWRSLGIPCFQVAEGNF